MRAPKHTTHVMLVTEFNGTKREAKMLLKDMDCLKGSPGVVTYLRQLHGKDRYENLGSFDFDGQWPVTAQQEK